jgi:hypothetical protein
VLASLGAAKTMGSRSRDLLFQPVVMVQAIQKWIGSHPQMLWKPMQVCWQRHRYLWRSLRNTWASGHVRTTGMVMSDPGVQHASPVVRAQRDYAIPALPPHGA